jgi:zinc transporter 5/7
LPEALTALLIPLPYFFASLAYPGIVAHGRRLPSGLGATGTQFPEAAPKETAPQYLVDGSQLLHACTLSSAMLILVGLVSKIRSSVDQPLDRRKSIGTSAPPRDTLFNISGAGRILTNILTAVLPFYATMQLGGARTAIVLLVGITAGLGGLEHKPGKHTLWDDTRRTLRTRKATCGIVSAAIVLDTLSSPSQSAATFGYLALITWILAIPSPLPATGWSIMTGLRTADSATRASLPKPLSPLISTPEETLLTLVSGALLTVITIIFSIVSSSSPSIGYHAMLFSAVSVACATALVFLSLPSALRTQKKIGFALGILLIIAFGVLEHPVWWQAWIVFPLGCALLFGAVVFDTGTILSQAHAHDHSHSGHAHSHAHHHAQDHHLHGNHSSLSAFIINRCTPGSIAHSILIEKDSRRIAYFGMYVKHIPFFHLLAALESS